MIILFSLTTIILFIITLGLSGIIRKGNEVFVIVQDSLSVMRDPSLDDDIREKKVQQASMWLFRAFLSILIRSLLVFLLSALPLLLADRMAVVAINDVIQYLSRWDVIGITTFILCIGYVVWSRTRSSSTAVLQVNYSFMDRLLHRIAFSSTGIQLTAADIENSMYRDVFKPVEARKPIFITSLPRAGTTMMLEVFHQFPSLTTHIYRDMPFMMAPILWSNISRFFYKADHLQERAHGDGMEIGYNSPEAFEEIIWRAFYPKKYTDKKIDLWKSDEIDNEATTFFSDHMKKIVALRNPERKQNSRYLSKNNGNIARLDLLKQMFSDAEILVPVRRPAEHAVSMLRQHRNFTVQHKNEPFIRRYMADIGHYEFGDLHRPIAFPGVEDYTLNRDPMSMDYWLGYWIAAFEHILSRRRNITVVSFEKTCLKGPDAISEICHSLEVPEEGMLETASSIIKQTPPLRADKNDFDSRLLSRAEELYDTLVS